MRMKISGKWLVIFAVAAAFVFLAGGREFISVAADWQFFQQSLLYLNSAPAGLVDPLFGRDISFYLFQYPLIGAVNTMLRVLIVISALLTAAVYLVRGGVVLMGRVFSVDPFVKRHVGVLVSLFLLSLSFSFVFGRYGLLTAGHGVLYGASYTDVHARLPMLAVMAALSLAAAIAVPVFAARGSLALPLAVLGVLLGVNVLGLQVYPSALQSFKVSPNVLVLERPYIADHIKFTRYGYGLENMELQPLAANK